MKILCLLCIAAVQARFHVSQQRRALEQQTAFSVREGAAASIIPFDGQRMAPRAVCVRGGATLRLDSRAAGKVLGWAYILQGVAFNLAPKPMNRLYGWEDESELAEYLAEHWGCSMLAVGVGASLGLLYDSNVTVKQILGWTSVVYLANYAQWTWTKRFELMGLFQFIAITLVSLVGALSAFTECSWALDYYKACAVVFSSLSVLSILFPEKSLSLWRSGQALHSWDDRQKILLEYRGLSFFQLGMCIFHYSLVQGRNVENSLAYGSLSGLVFFVTSIFLTRKVGEVSTNPAGYT